MKIAIGIIVAILVVYSFLSVFTSSYFGLVKTKSRKHNNISFIRLIPNLIVPIIIAAVLLIIYFTWWVSVFIVAGVIALIGVVWALYEKNSRIGPLITIMLGLAAALAAGTTIAIMELPAQLSYILMILGAAITSASVFVFILTPKHQYIGGGVLLTGLGTAIAGFIILLSPYIQWELLLLAVFCVAFLVNALLPVFTKEKSPTHYYTLTMFMVGIITMTALVMVGYGLELWAPIITCIGLAIAYFIFISIPSPKSQKKTLEAEPVIEPEHAEVVDDKKKGLTPVISQNVSNMIMAAVAIAAGILLFIFTDWIVALCAVLAVLYFTHNINSVIYKRYRAIRYWVSSLYALALSILLNYALRPIVAEPLYRFLISNGFYFLHVLYIHLSFVTYKAVLLKTNLPPSFKAKEVEFSRFVRRLKALRNILFPAAMTAFITRISIAIYLHFHTNPILASVIVAGMITFYALIEVIFHRSLKHRAWTAFYSFILFLGVTMLVVVGFVAGLTFWIPWATILIGVVASVVIFVGLILLMVYLNDESYYQKKKKARPYQKK